MQNFTRTLFTDFTFSNICTILCQLDCIHSDKRSAQFYAILNCRVLDITQCVYAQFYANLTGVLKRYVLCTILRHSQLQSFEYNSVCICTILRQPDWRTKEVGFMHSFMPFSIAIILFYIFFLCNDVNNLLNCKNLE